MAELLADGKLTESEFEVAQTPIKELWAELPSGERQVWHYFTSAVMHLGSAGAAAYAASFAAYAVATSVATERSDEWESVLRSEEKALMELSATFDAADVMPRKVEDPFADSDEWIAAEGRQLIRALGAYDPKAVDVCLFYMCDYLAKTLGRHLREIPRWQIPGLWFDGWDAAEVDVQLNSRMRIRGWIVCVGNEKCWREPVEFDLRLYARSGRFQGYRFRFGDSRSRDEKAIIGLEMGMSRRIELNPFRITELAPQLPEPVGEWVDEIVRGKITD